MNYIFGVFQKSLFMAPFMLLCLLLNRKFGNRFSAVSRCRIWMVLLLLVLIPTGIFNVKMYVPQAKTEEKSNAINAEVINTEAFNNHTGLSATESVETQENQPLGLNGLSSVPAMNNEASVKAEKSLHWEQIFLIVWALGATFVVAVYVLSFFKLRKTISDATVMLHGSTCYYRSDRVKAPMLCGLFSPKVVLPSGCDSWADTEMILLHELTHIRRLDILKKYIALLVNCFLWFNPFIWCIRKQLSRDIEFATDEIVTRDMTDAKRIAYSELILEFAKNSSYLSTASFFSQKSNLKERIETIMDKRKAKKGIPALALLVVIGIATSVTVSKIPVKADSSKVEEQSVMKNDSTEVITYENITTPKEEVETVLPEIEEVTEPIIGEVVEPLEEPEEVTEPVTEPFDDGVDTPSYTQDTILEPETIRTPENIEFGDTGAFTAITSEFGDFTNPVTGEVISHDGIDLTVGYEFGADIADYVGTSVGSIIEGTVVETGYSSEWGYYVVIVGAEGYELHMRELASVTVDAGSYVEIGQEVGLFGQAEGSTGPCVHVGIKHNDIWENPLDYLK